MLVRQAEVDPTFPCAKLEHLTNILKNGMNSQRNPRFYEVWKPKLQMTLKNRWLGDCVGLVRSLGPLQGPRLPWFLARCLMPGSVAPTGALEKRQISNCNSTTPSPTRIEKAVTHHERPGYLKSLEGKKDAVGDAQRQCSPAGTVVTKQDIAKETGDLGDTWKREKSWAVVDPDLDSLQTGPRVGLCEKPGAC